MLNARKRLEALQLQSDFVSADLQMRELDKMEMKEVNSAEMAHVQKLRVLTNRLTQSYRRERDFLLQKHELEISSLTHRHQSQLSQSVSFVVFSQIIS